jgi:hypothetical protein
MLFLSGCSHETHKQNTLKNDGMIHYYIMYANKFSLTKNCLCESHINNPETACIGVKMYLEQTDAEKGILPKWFYTGKANV